MEDEPFDYENNIENDPQTSSDEDNQHIEVDESDLHPNIHKKI